MSELTISWAWVSVKDELPPSDKEDAQFSIDVIITDGENVGTGYYEYEYFGEPGEELQYSSPVWWPHGQVLNGDIDGWPKVTHWMPAPEPPKQMKKEKP